MGVLWGDRTPACYFGTKGTGNRALRFRECNPVLDFGVMKRRAKWRSLGQRLAKLKDGESIVLEREGDLTEEARKIRSGLNGIRACMLVRRTVKVVGGKIVITRVGSWPTLLE